MSKPETPGEVAVAKVGVRTRMHAENRQRVKDIHETLKTRLGGHGVQSMTEFLLALREMSRDKMQGASADEFVRLQGGAQQIELLIDALQTESVNRFVI